MRLRRRFSSIVALVACAILIVGALLTARPAGGQSPASFEGLPDLVTPRAFHGATALADGRVLLTGGFLGGSPLNTPSAEVFLPDEGRFVDAGLMSLPRNGHSATLLQNGDVLLAGGNSLPFEPVASAERFDAASGGFVTAATLAGPRALHTATLLDDGRVLIVGGISGGAGSELAAAEIYDPIADRFSATGALSAARAQHTATLLPDGRVLIVGGAGPTGAPVPSEFYDPVSGSFSDAPAMVVPRVDHTSVALRDGRVLISGGRDASFRTLSVVEVFDPTTGGFHVVASLLRARQGHSATLLIDGRVLILGGLDAPALAADGAELYDPAVAGSSTLLDRVVVARSFHSATRLPDGRVVIGGGTGPLAAGSAERFTPPPPPDRGVALVAGWSLIAWTGEETPVALAIAGTPAISRVFVWDGAAQQFRAFVRGAPPSLNTLLTFAPGQGIWVFAGQPEIWRMPGVDTARAVSLVAGFNLAGWTGPDSVSIGEIAQALGPAVVAIYRYDPLSQRFEIFRPGAPAALNTASVLNHGEGVWIQLSAAVVWLQPASGAR
ncbi:MAG: Galactose oxidase, central domain [Chloroflexi bacterium]|nr:MAG: Galactose oxidase, central domain [Chloroflexota bacterium]